jgi:hypothetical protein
MLEEIDAKPLLISEGAGHLAVPHHFPSTSMPRVSSLSRGKKKDLERSLDALALMSTPALAIEDTHPLGLELCEDVTRVLILRPTLPGALMNFHRGYGHIYQRVLVADHPGSPTWPYGSSETRLIRSWHGWHFAGPIYRTAHRNEVADVRARYGWSPGRRFCVFSLGGGGEHDGADDAGLFLDTATDMARTLLRLDRHAQPILVKGPLFANVYKIPGIFRVVDHEPLMPALFAAADLAVIRPGFNSVWECIAGGTPIIPVSGTSFQEPVMERLKNLRANGLLAESIEEVWRDARMRARVAGRCTDIVGRWTGRIDQRLLRSVVNQASKLRVEVGGSDKPDHSSPMSKTYRTAAKRRLRPPELRHREISPTAVPPHPLVSGKSRRLLFRLDDVTEFDDTTKRLLDLAMSRNVRVSLEIIPYLCRISDAEITGFGLDSDAVEVGQHGFAHLPEWISDSSKGEFAVCVEAPAQAVEALAAGKLMMEQRFAKVFRRGFSPPYDKMAPWIAETWCQLGGCFISVIRNRPRGARIPYVVISGDVWNWSEQRMHSSDFIHAEIALASDRLGYAGLLLHPRHFRRKENLHWLAGLLEELKNAGFQSALPSELAIPQAELVVESPTRQYLCLGRKELLQ